MTRRNYLWAFLFPAALVLSLVWFAFLPPLAHDISQAELAKLFLKKSIAACRPETLEHLRYIATVLLVPPLFLIWLRLEQPLSRWLGDFVPRLGAVARLLALSALFGMAIAQDRWVHAYADWRQPLRQLLALTLIAGLWKLIGERARTQGKVLFARAPEGLFTALAAGYTGLQVAGAVFTDGNLSHASSNVITHMPFTMGEFAAATNGRVPLVDFQPQYENLLCLWLKPIFGAAGPTVFSYTLAMSLLSWLSFYSVFFVFRLLTGHSRQALALFLPWMAVSSIALALGGSEGQTIFNYYALSPLRYFFPWLTCLLLMRWLIRPSRARLLPTFGMAALGVLNNFEFGVPAAIACSLAVLFSSPKRRMPALKTYVLAIGGMALAVFMVFGAYAAYAWLRTQALPDFGKALEYAQVYSTYGFYMIPMPATGYHWIFLFTFLAAVAYGLVSQESRAMKGALIFSGVFGAGSMFYYVGRSHWQVLPAVFPSWGFSFLLLAWSHSRRQPSERALPTRLALGLTYFYLFSFVPAFPGLSEQVSRFSLHDGGYTSQQARYAEFIRARIRPGEEIMVSFAMGHTLASRVGATNIFPFTHPELIVLKSQAETVEKLIVRHHLKHVFGNFPEELESWLKQAGYEKSASEGELGYYVKN